jgi:hypothetical protein
MITKIKNSLNKPWNYLNSYGLATPNLLDSILATFKTYYSLIMTQRPSRKSLSTCLNFFS